MATASVTADTLGKALRGQLEGLRKPIKDIAQRFGVVRESIKEYAPKVMRLFNAIKAENERFTFVEFVRLFDPGLPTRADDLDGIAGYKTNKVYYTLDYMRRLNVQRPRGRAGVRDSAADGLARSIATILQVVPEGQADQVWKAIQAEFTFNERIMGRLRKRVEATKPLFTINVPPKAHLKIGNVIHMERQNAAPDERGAEPLAQRGRRVKVAA